MSKRLMEQLLRSHQAYVATYIDDMVIHSEEREMYLQQVWAVLGSLRRAGLTANPKKCRFGLSEEEYLGYTIGSGVIHPQTKKVAAIREWRTPVRKK